MAALGVVGPETAGPLSHDRSWTDDVVQDSSPPGRIDLGPGYLEPALLPVDLLQGAYARALAEFGSAALAYGANNGATELRAALAARAAAADGSPCEPGQVLVTAGTTQALYLISTALAAPGDVVFVDQHSYDLGRRIFADCGLLVRAVAADEEGMDPAALDEAIAAERGRGNGIGFVCLNPTFHNPTGLLVPERRRRELVAVAGRREVLLVEDDAYAELALDEVRTPASCAALSGYRGVIRLGSFAKTIGPGLRLGWLVADRRTAERLADRGVFVSGGSLNHTTSLAVTVLLRDGDYDRHLSWLRAQLAARRDALAGALRAEGAGAPEFHLPAGGFFLWIRPTGATTEAELLAAADRAGVRVAAGSRFGEHSRPAVRLAYSLNSPVRLAAAGARLAAAWPPDTAPA